MTGHRLDPMLTPRSIAFVGASERKGTVGHGMVAGVLSAGFGGDLYAVNPKYDTVQGLPSYASLADLPGPVDLAVLGVNSIRIEQQMSDAIALGARSCVIFDSCYLDDETDRGLLTRLRAMAREADLPVCGGNGMGFLNVDGWLPITLYDAVPRLRRGGNVAFITHSGTVFSEIGLNDPRYICNLIVSCGQEINGTMADYIDYALGLSSTRVIALFMETARDPESMVRAFAKAQSQGVPVVVMKVGRTALAARFAQVHSGADVGDDDAYQALFDRYDVIRVETMDDMANLLTLLSNRRSLAPGGIAAMLDSGGEREMLVDLAAAAGTPLARLSGSTLDTLRARLHHSLEAVNPLDAWGVADNYEADFEEYLATMACDPDTALTLFCGDMTWSPNVLEGYPKVLVQATARTEKPVAALINMPTSGFMEVGVGMSEAGVAVLSGTKSGLTAIRHAMDWRDRMGASHDDGLEPIDHAVVKRWRDKLCGGSMLDAADGSALLADFGLATSTDLQTTDHEAEIALAMRRDPQLGPIVRIASGGMVAAVLDDACHAMVPFGSSMARRLIERLALRPLLERQAAGNIAAVVRFVSNFSILCATLGDLIDLIELKCAAAGGDGCTAFDVRFSARSDGSTGRV
jgi:acyl-CoA synthetase (NDP forming)